MARTGRPRKPVLERIAQRYEVVDDCHVWISTKDRDGYAQIGIGRTGAHRVTRVLWKEIVGEIPDGMLVCHSCDNRSCINLKHLFLGTPKDNTQDMMRKGRNHVTKGEGHPMRKLSWTSVEKVHRMRSEGQTLKQIGDQFGVCFQTISQVVRGETWNR